MFCVVEKSMSHNEVIRNMLTVQNKIPADQPSPKLVFDTLKIILFTIFEKLSEIYHL